MIVQALIAWIGVSVMGGLLLGRVLAGVEHIPD